MGVEFSCPTLILLPMPAVPVPGHVEGSAAAAVTGSAESNGAATPAAASLSVSRRVKGGFIRHSPTLRTLAEPFLLKHHGIYHGSRAPRSAESSTEALAYRRRSALTLGLDRQEPRLWERPPGGS